MFENILLTDEKMLPFPEMRSKLYKSFYDHKNLREADLRVTLRPDGKLKQIFLFVNGEWILVCGTHEYRESLMPTIYEYAANILKCDNIVECGIGTGIILDFLPELFTNYTIVEINTKLCKLFSNDNIINDEFYGYIKNKKYSNTMFIDRSPTVNFRDITEYTKYILNYFKNKQNCNNYVLIETPKINFNLDNIVFELYNDQTNTRNYILKI